MDTFFLVVFSFRDMQPSEQQQHVTTESQKPGLYQVPWESHFSCFVQSAHARDLLHQIILFHSFFAPTSVLHIWSSYHIL